MLTKNIFVVLSILIVAFAAVLISAPGFFNRRIDSISAFSFFQPPRIPEIPFLLGLDLQGGIHLVYEADLSKTPDAEKADLMSGLRDVIERRVNYFGVQEPLVQTQQARDRWRLIVELAGVKDVKQAIETIGATPHLEFKKQRTEEETQKILDQQKELAGKTQEELAKIPASELALAMEDPYFAPTQLTGQYLKSAKMEFDRTTYQPYVALEFNKEGSDIFEELTGQNVGKKIAIYIDGQLISSPVVQEKISGGKAQITGQFTVDEAKRLARNLSAGALPVPITLISQQTVGPSLGAISLQRSLKAGFIGTAAVILFLLLFYRIPGAIAVVALSIYLAVLLALFKLIPVTLTLAGIGGVILSVGMAVDANILIFSRMREELSAGKNFGQAVAEGFHRAWPSIRDGNLTTLLVALILFYFGTSFVKGFALTLSLGIVLSMISAIFVTRYFLKVFEGTALEKIHWLWR